MTNEIDWSKAPEGATHYDTRSDVYPWLKEDDNGNKYWNFDMWVNYANDIGVNDSIFAKPLQPVFTKAMADKGELPSVGMECIYIKEVEHTSVFSDAIGRKVKVICHHNNMALIHWAGSYEAFSHRAFKPITPPIELIDGKAYQFDCNGHVDIIGVLNNDNGSFYDSNVNAYNIDYCTNIQLLEVKS